MNAPGDPMTAETLAGWTPQEREALFSAVDESDYSLDDWLEALGSFCAWLEEEGESRRPCTRNCFGKLKSHCIPSTYRIWIPEHVRVASLRRFRFCEIRREKGRHGWRDVVF
jgi:hypothetical protein